MLRAVRLGEGGGGALGLRRGQVLSQQGRRGVQYAVIGGWWVVVEDESFLFVLCTMH